MPDSGGRVLRATELLVTPSAAASLAAAALDAMADAGLERAGAAPPADVLIIAVPPGRGNGALNVALRAVELDLAGDGAELERRLYG